MKKVLLVCAFLVGLSTLSFAQGGGPQGTPEERAKMTVDGQRMTAFNFTADQKAKVVAILTKQNKSSDSLRAANAGGDRAAMAPKLAPISAVNEAAIVALLTADQKKAYDTALAAAKERNPNATAVFTGGGGRGGQGGGRGGNGGGAPATPPAGGAK